MQMKSRPPGIYKSDYLHTLADRLNGGSMADIGVPTRPAWCNEEHTPEAEKSMDDKTTATRKRGKDKQNDVSAMFSTSLLLLCCCCC